jgi:DNA-binding LacI/PurR family transcriptional regulator
MSVTIKDIAQVAGVSHITVSRALNGSTAVRPDTREHIKKIADELGYIPNINARSLVLAQSNVIGLFFSTLQMGTSAEFFQQAVLGTNSVLGDQYNVAIKGIDEYHNHTLLNRSNFAGILIMSQREEDDIFIQKVLDKEIPVIVMNRAVEMPGVINILLNDKQGAYQATRYLVEQGHQKIAVIQGVKGFKSSFDRMQGCQQAANEYGIEFCEDFLRQGDYGFESGYNNMKELLTLLERPTAVFCFNDDMALGAMKAAYERGLKIPDDLAVVGFDDSFFSLYTMPSLTTVRRPIKKMSQVGASCLLDILNGQGKLTDRIYIDTTLIIRDSV